MFGEYIKTFENVGWLKVTFFGVPNGRPNAYQVDKTSKPNFILKNTVEKEVEKFLAEEPWLADKPKRRVLESSVKWNEFLNIEIKWECLGFKVGHYLSG